MRILIFGTGSQDVASANCGLALRSLGHDVLHFDPEDHPLAPNALRSNWLAKRVVSHVIGRIPQAVRLLEDSLLRTAASFGPDLILVIPIQLISQRAIARLKRETGAKVAGWFQDAIVNLGRHDFVMADYDGLFFKDPMVVERLRDFGGMQNVHFLPEGCEPSRHRSVELSEADWERYGCDLMFYGNLYPYRARLLESLQGLPIRFYGDRPGRWIDHPLARSWHGHPIYFDDKCRAVQCAKIVLSTSHFGEIRSVNARVFEVAGIGGFQLADAPGVADYFEPGTEIVTFRGPKQLREAVDHYLHEPEERGRIASRGQARAHRDHTYSQRLQQLLRTIGLAS